VKQAILGNPDAATRRAMGILNQTLTIEERQYLRNMHWTGQTRDTLASDPPYNKALVALSTAQSGLTVNSVSPLVEITPSPTAPEYLVNKIIKAMADCLGEDKCQGDGCVAATAEAYRRLYGDVVTSPTSPKYGDNGTWTCTTDFFADGGQGSESCDFRGYCHAEEINLSANNGAGSYKCNDPGWTPTNAPACTPVDAGADAVVDAVTDAGVISCTDWANCQKYDAAWFGCWITDLSCWAGCDSLHNDPDPYAEAVCDHDCMQAKSTCETNASFSGKKCMDSVPKEGWSSPCDQKYSECYNRLLRAAKDSAECHANLNVCAGVPNWDTCFAGLVTPCAVAQQQAVLTCIAALQ
jgi:hypothetical protein